MGLLNKIWSGADFWDKKENAKQRQDFKAQDDEEKRRKAAEAQARAQANATRPTQQQSQKTTVSVDEAPRKPTSVTVDAPRKQPTVQVYQPVNQSKVTVQAPTAEQTAVTQKTKELEAFKQARMSKALEDAKKQTSWFDRQFTDRGWDKRAEAMAVSGAAKDYQEKYGYNKDQQVLNYGRSASSKLDQAENTNASKWIAPVISTGRVGTGMVEGVGGLYDLATPGKGTNRFTQAANKKAVEQDQLAKDMGIEGIYKAGNVVGEIASYAIPGMAGVKVAKGANATAKGAKLTTAMASKIDDVARLIDKGGDGNKVRQFLAARVRQNFTIEEAVQELMITGRYMGQNTARGGDTSIQSIATDAAMGLGGALLMPAKGYKQIFNSLDDGLNGQAGAQAADDVVGSTIAGATEYLDNALTKGADIPPVKPGIDAPVVPKPSGTEVSPGVISVNTTPEPVVPPTPTPNVVPQTAPTTPTVQQPTNVPPVQQQLDLPEAPRVNEAPQYQQIEAPQKPVPLEQAPTPVQAVPETAPVTTPIEQASQEVIQNNTPTVVPQRAPAPTPVTANTSDEALDGLRGQREDLTTLRDSMAAEGLDTIDLDRQIARLDEMIAGKVNKPSKEATVLAEGDKQLEEAVAPAKKNKKPEITKQEAPSKPKKKDDAKNVNLSADELRARGVSEEGIAREMARQAEAEAPKVTKSKKGDVAQSEPTPVKPTKTKEKLVLKTKAEKAREAAAEVPVKPEKPFKPEPKNVGKAKEAGAKTLDEMQALDTEIERIRTRGKEMNLSDRAIQEQIDKVTALANAPKKPAVQLGDPEKVKTPAQVKAENQKQAVDDAIMGRTELSKPKKPTQAQLNKGAIDNTLKSGKVSEAWKKKQTAAGATEKQLEKAVEKVEGKKPELTDAEKELAARRAENNRVGRENKAKARAEGKDKQAAPNVTKALSDQTAKTITSPKERASIARRYSAETKGVNIEEGMIKAQKSLDEVSDDGVLEHVRKLLDDTNEIDDADRVFNSIAISKRLDSMREAAGEAGLKLDDDLIKLADEVAQTQALTASTGGLLNRLTQEIYKNIPAPVRVQKRLDEITKRFEDMKVDFKPSEADKEELIKMTYTFDKSSTSMLGFEDELNATRADYDGKTTPEQGDELFNKHKQLDADYRKSQEEAIASSLAFNEKLKSIIPELPRKEKLKQFAIKSPDHVGNYLRLAMLSAPSGRARDALSTGINVADQSMVNLISSTIGKGSNKLLGTNVIDSYGSKAATKKGVTGAWDKIKASWSGKPTLDEATGRGNTNSRAELSKKETITSFGIDHGSKGSKWNLPKKAIITGTQAPTDTSFGLFTDRLYKLGEVDARANGITDKKQIKQYAEMFMDNPPKEAALDAGEVWLGASGMQKNKLSKKLTKIADELEAWGNKSVDGDGNKLSTAQRTGRKSLAVTVRMTTIPFVQYTGGSTHAMLMKQNPVSNVSQLIKAHKAGNTQAVVDNLSRTVWNSAKIGGLIAAMETNAIETSDTDADGVTTYNGPYVVRTGADGKKEFIPMGTYGIAAGAALISAHYLRRGYDKMKNGDVVGGVSDIVAGPPMAIVKASGLDNMMSGSNIMGGATENFEQSNSDPDMTPGDVALTVGAGLAGDIGSQGVPAASRDLNSGFDNGWKVGGKTIIEDTWNPTKEKPDTSGKDPVTGKVDPVLKAKAQITSGIPGLSQQLPRKSGEQARTFQGRVLNANTQSEQQKAGIAADKTEETTTVNRTADVVSDNKVAGLLSEETRAIYDKYKGDMSKASQEDSKKIWKEVTEAKDRLLDDGSYESYSKILTYERDEGKAKGTSTATEIAEMDRKIARSNVAKDLKTKPQVFRLYSNVDTPEGGGISQGEFKKMLELDDDGNPKYPEVYDPETATLLWELDEAMTKAGASANTNGLDPWTRNKYNLDEALGRGKYAKKGSGSKDKGVGTDFGTLGAYAKPPSGSQSQKYQDVDARSPLANLTKQSSKTNLKKNISVVKGVRL